MKFKKAENTPQNAVYALKQLNIKDIYDYAICITVSFALQYSWVINYARILYQNYLQLVVKAFHSNILQLLTH